MNDTWITTREAAARRGVSVSTIARWVRLGGLAARRIGRYQYVIDPAALAVYQPPALGDTTAAPSRLRDLRRRRGLSRAAVAAALGVTRSAVGAWESGAWPPSPAHAAALAVLLGEE